MLPSFDHSIQIILALTPLIVAFIGAAVAIAQILAAREKKAKAAKAGEAAAELPPVTGVTTPVDDDHADDAIAALRSALEEVGRSRDDWRQRALDAEPRLRAANVLLQQHGLPTT